LAQVAQVHQMVQILHLELLNQLEVAEAVRQQVLDLQEDLVVVVRKTELFLKQVAQQVLVVKVMLVVLHWQAVHFLAVAVEDLVLLGVPVVGGMQQHLHTQVHLNLMQVADLEHRAVQQQLQLLEQMLAQVQYQQQMLQMPLLITAAEAAEVRQRLHV
jgi:hypothetical protein